MAVFPTSVSDHDFVIMTFDDFCPLERGPGYWKFNNSLLDDKTFCNKLRDFLNTALVNVDISIEFWEQLKENIRDFVQNYSKLKSKTRFAVLNKLYRQFQVLNKNEKLSPGDYSDQILALQKYIEEFQAQRFFGARIRSRAQILDNNEKPSRFFFQKELKRSSDKTIKNLNYNGKIADKTSDIIEATVDFYEKLFSSQSVDEEQFDTFLSDLPHLSDASRRTLDKDLNKDEIYLALKAMDNNKSPGSDGLTKEFYLSFFDVLGDVLLNVYLLSFNSKLLPDTMRTSYITLICKDQNNSSDLKFWRPISLLNYDYKILSKLLTKRLSLVMDEIVHPDQTCAVKGRSILDNVHLMRNIMD